MPWFKVDDGLWAHPKFAALSDSAQALWLRSGAWCAQQLTDGLIPAHMAPMLRLTDDAAGELVKHGLWDEEGGSYRFHDWSEYQPTRAEEEEKREKWRERQRQSREKRHANVTRDTQRDSRVSHQPDVTRESTSPVPSRPVPSHREGRAKNTRSRLTDDFTPTDAHASKAKELGVDLNTELERFKNHFIGNGDAKADWGRTFSNWLSRAQQFNGGNKPTPPQPSFDPWAGDWSEDEMRRNT